MWVGPLLHSVITRDINHSFKTWPIKFFLSFINSNFLSWEHLVSSVYILTAWILKDTESCLNEHICVNNSVDSRTRGLSRGLWENQGDIEQNTVQKPSLSDGRLDVTFLRQQTDNSLCGKTGKIFFFIFPHSSSSGWQEHVENGRGQSKPSSYFKEIS